MLTLIIRKKNKEETGLVEIEKLAGDAPLHLSQLARNVFQVCKVDSKHQIVFERDNGNFLIKTDLSKVSIDNENWILPDTRLQNLQTANHDIQIYMEEVLDNFLKNIRIKATVSKQVKYIEEITKCFTSLITKEKTLKTLQKWLLKCDNSTDHQLEEILKEILSEIEFEDYDRTQSLSDLSHTLQRKYRDLKLKKITFLEIDQNTNIKLSDLEHLQEELNTLNVTNFHVQKLKNKISVNFPEVAIWRDLNSLDQLARHFNKNLADDRANRTITRGCYIYVDDLEIEISNIINPDRPDHWAKPFDPELTYKEVDQLLNSIKESEFVKQSKVNYLKTKMGDTKSQLEKQTKEQELIEEIESNLPTIRNLIRFDCKIRNFSKGSKKKPEIICRKNDFGNSAFFIVTGKVDVLLDQKSSIPEEHLGRQKVNKKGFFRSIAQLLTNKHHMNEYRSKSQKDLTKENHSIFIQDFDQVLINKHIDQVVSLNAGNTFGEISAMGRTPRSATVIATEPVTLLEIRWQGLRDLRETLPILKEITDANFRERGLIIHIRETEMFKGMEENVLMKLIDKCVFQSYGDFKWSMSYKDLAKKGDLNNLINEPIIVSEGDYPDGIFLIRSGFVRVSRKFNNGHLTKNYLGKGSVFGFEELKYNYENPNSQKNHSQSLRAIGYVDVIFIPAAIVEKYIFQKDKISKALHDTNPQALELEIEPEKQKISIATMKAGMLSQEVIESLVSSRSINATEAMLINIDRCTRCDDCVVACANAHDGNPRFIRHGKIFDKFMITNACMHCNDPVCMIGCPTGAINRNTEGGEVIINDSTCIGCSTCANSCPYDNIRMVEYTEQRSKSTKKDLNTKEPLLKATKCDLCIDQLGGPACERACPHDALKRVDLSEITKVEGWISNYKNETL